MKSYCLKEKIQVHVYYYWLSRLQTMETQEADNNFPVIIEKPGQDKRTNDLNLELPTRTVLKCLFRWNVGQACYAT